MTDINLDTKQKSAAYSQATQNHVVDEVIRLQRLSEYALEAAETLTRLSLQCFKLACDGAPDANRLGTNFLDCAERFSVEARGMMAESKRCVAGLRT